MQYPNINFRRDIKNLLIIKRVLIISIIIGTSPVHSFSQEKESCFNNRISLGTGGENSLLGIDYSRNIYKSKLAVGLAGGVAGWELYLKYEVLNWHGFIPFASSGISYTPNGTISMNQNTSVFFASIGLNYLPPLAWRCVPVVSVGATSYSLILGKAEGGLGNLGPILKLGFAFPRKE